VRIFRRQSDHAAGADRATRVRSALVRRAGQPDHGDQPDHLRVRPRCGRPAARSLGKLHAAVLRLYRGGADGGGADHDPRAAPREIVARMSAAISGTGVDATPDVASLIRATGPTPAAAAADPQDPAAW